MFSVREEEAHKGHAGGLGDAGCLEQLDSAGASLGFSEPIVQSTGREWLFILEASCSSLPQGNARDCIQTCLFLLQRIFISESG